MIKYKIRHYILTYGIPGLVIGEGLRTLHVVGLQNNGLKMSLTSIEIKHAPNIAIIDAVFAR